MVFRAAVILVLIASLQTDTFADWWRFRGPNGSGVSPETVPTQWSPTKNLKWKVALPGPGSSSPIIVGDRVFVTCCNQDYSSPVVAGDKIYFQTRKGDCFVVDAGDNFA